MSVVTSSINADETVNMDPEKVRLDEQADNMFLQGWRGAGEAIYEQWPPLPEPAHI